MRAALAPTVEPQILLVIDADVARLGVATPAQAALAEVGTVEVWSPPPGEPTLATARELTAHARSLRPNIVVGLGGGTALDLAKIAAAAVTNDGPTDGFIGVNAIANDPVPMVLIPTTSGTGSEVTGVCLLNADGRKAVVNSPRLIPLAAILDPLLTVSLPKSQTAATGLDALSHALESLLSTRATALTVGAANGATDLIASYLEPAYLDGNDVAARRALLYGAHLAGLALNAGVVIGHSIAYTIANRVNLAHGVTSALALPFCLRYNAAPGSRRLAGAIDRMRAEGDIDTLSLALRALASRIGIPQSLRDVGIKRSDIPRMVTECMESYPRPNNPVRIEQRELTDLYEHLYDGDVNAYKGPQ